MAIVSGLVCVAAGLARLGFITELLSKPIRYGYMNGIALTVILSQIPKLLGFSVKADGPLRQAWGIVEGVSVGAHEPRRRSRSAAAPRADSLAEAAAARPGHAGRGRGRHRCGRGVRSRSPGGDIRAWSAAAGAACAAAAAGACRRAWSDRHRRASPSRSSPSPTPVCSRGPMRRACGRRSTRTRKWWALASRTSRPASSRAFRSAAVRRARRWRRRRAPERS